MNLILFCFICRAKETIARGGNLTVYSIAAPKEIVS